MWSYTPTAAATVLPGDLLAVSTKTCCTGRHAKPAQQHAALAQEKQKPSNTPTCNC